MYGDSAMINLKEEYQTTYEQVRELRIQREKDPNHSEHDLRILKSMERSLKETVSIMDGTYRKTGEILCGSSYELEIIAARSSAFMNESIELTGGSKVVKELEILPALKELLSDREFVCILAFEHGMSLDAIASHLSISRSTVQRYIMRAREKLTTMNSLQLALF